MVMDLIQIWIKTKLLSTDAATRLLAYATVLYLGLASTFAFLNPVGFLYFGGSPLSSIWAFAILVSNLANVHYEQKYNEQSKQVLISRLFLYIFMASGVGIYYDGCNQALRPRFAREGEAMLWDEFILTLDESLVGFLFPYGQLSLFLDQSEAIGPSSFIGRLYGEILQVSYTSYYVWGNGLGVYLAIHYFSSALFNRPINGENMPEAHQWRRLQMFTAAWAGGFLFNFILNMTFPAVSPRIFLKDMYVHDIEGIFFANGLRGALANAAASTFSAFPSGHCGMSWLTSAIAYRMGLTFYAKVSFIVGVMITLATQVLRYHYFSDMLFASTLLAVGMKCGGMWEQAEYDCNVTGRKYVPGSSNEADIEVAVDKPTATSEV